VLLAGLFAAGETRVEQPVPTRDHTERMLRALGAEIAQKNGTVAVAGGARLRPFELTVPGDISSAAFLFGAALLTGGEITVEGCGVNPTRAALLRVLESMGARIDVSNERDEMGEPVADVSLSGGLNHPFDLAGADIPLL